MIEVAMLVWAAQLAAPPATPPAPLQFAQVTIRRQIIIRTIRVGPAAATEWKEKKGPRCVQPQTISGAAHLGQRSVDLLLRNGSRLRAQLTSSCPALDYYGGFYITPGEDGLICADREAIRSRAGGECEIEAFRSLEAVTKSVSGEAP